MGLELLIGMIYFGLVRRVRYQFVIVKVIVLLIKEEEDDMVEFWKYVYLFKI